MEGQQAARAAADEAGTRPLTNRQRRQNKKRQQRYAQVAAASIAFRAEETRRARREKAIRDWIAAGANAYRGEWKRTPEPPIERVQLMLNRVEQRMVRRGEKASSYPIDLRRMDRRFWEMLFICGWNPHWFDFKSKMSVDAWWRGDTWQMTARDRDHLMEVSRELFDADAAFPTQERAEDEDRRVRTREIGRPPLRSNAKAALNGGAHFPPFSGHETSGLDEATAEKVVQTMLLAKE